METKITIPILLVGFNRPHCIRKVMQKLAEVKPINLYVSIDAPRDNVPSDVCLVEEVKAIVKDVTWDCNVHYKFYDSNVGAEVNVSNGVSWVLEENDYVIVNEDDIYAGFSFYKFEQDMLLRYKDDERIGLVSGFNLSENSALSEEYYFSRSGKISGWGTWKRVWKDYNLAETIEDKYISVDYLEPICISLSQAKRVNEIMKNQKMLGKGKITWDFIFWYLRLKKKYLGIVPSHNLVSNIGVVGLHGRGYNFFNFTPIDEHYQIAKFRDVEWDRDYDTYVYTNEWHFSIWKRIKNRLLLEYRRRFVFNDSFLNSFYNS